MQLLDRTNGVLLNAQEARQLTEERSLAQAATQLHRWGSGIVVIKRGARGALLSYQAEKMLDVPAFAVDGVKDPSGAGDSFAGAFIGSLSRAQELDFECFREALVAASVMASFCVEGFSVEGLQQLEASTFRQRWAWLESHAHLHRD
jgi:sugar/nucleoside kinase (ribokinase family)